MNAGLLWWILSLIGALVSLILRTKHASDAFIIPAISCCLTMFCITLMVCCQ